MSKRSVSVDRGSVPVDRHLTRRAALGVLASTALLPIPKTGLAASSPDPVFAAIERHRAAWSVLGVTSRATDEVAAQRNGREVTQADWEAYDLASVVEQAAFRELLDTPPRSGAGARSVIEYFLAFDDGYLAEMARPFLAGLLASGIFAV